MSVTRALSRSMASSWPGARAEKAAATSAEEVRSIEDRVCAYFRELGDPVFRYLAHCCRDAGDAEELRQEAFLRLYWALKREDQIENVRCWVFKVARNLMLDRAKRLRRSAKATCEMPDDAAERLADKSPSPEEQLAQREEIWEAMRGLTEKQRNCLYLRAQGLQLREIGDILDMDLRRVAEVLQRAVASVKRTMHARQIAAAERDLP
jgi:RNA polymerase sigma-70 factor (ECF subfamily)